MSLLRVQRRQHALTLCTGRNVIIEQSFGGPKITKGLADSCLSTVDRVLTYMQTVSRLPSLSSSKTSLRTSVHGKYFYEFFTGAEAAASALMS